MAHRNTLRKNIIERILVRNFKSKPVLLEELRWATFVEEKKLKKQDSHFLQRSYRNSFTRTIREHMPELIIHKLSILDTPLRIIARAAVFRLEDKILIDRFLSSKTPSIVISTDVVSTKDIGRIIRCQLYKRQPFVKYGPNYLDRVLLPFTIPISIVACAILNDNDFFSLADSSWTVWWAGRKRPQNAIIANPLVALQKVIQEQKLKQEEENREQEDRWY